MLYIILSTLIIYSYWQTWSLVNHGLNGIRIPLWFVKTSFPMVANDAFNVLYPCMPNGEGRPCSCLYHINLFWSSHWKSTKGIILWAAWTIPMRKLLDCPPRWLRSSWPLWKLSHTISLVQRHARRHQNNSTQSIVIWRNHCKFSCYCNSRNDVILPMVSLVPHP